MSQFHVGLARAREGGEELGVTKYVGDHKLALVVKEIDR